VGCDKQTKVLIYLNNDTTNAQLNLNFIISNISYNTQCKCHPVLLWTAMNMTLNWKKITSVCLWITETKC